LTTNPEGVKDWGGGVRKGRYKGGEDRGKTFFTLEMWYGILQIELVGIRRPDSKGGDRKNLL